MKDFYHQAVKDRRFEILKQATKKDLNQEDEDGRTPTHWAAYQGDMDALSLCCSRGGDPNKSDYFGNTALHFATANGHMKCLRFLVSFEANIWQMDNNFHTPMDVAAINEKQECVEYLDKVIGNQKAENRKKVERQQKKAKIDAEKRIKRYNALMKQQEKVIVRNRKASQSSANVTRSKDSGKNISTVAGDISFKPTEADAKTVTESSVRQLKLPEQLGAEASSGFGTMPIFRPPKMGPSIFLPSAEGSGVDFDGLYRSPFEDPASDDSQDEVDHFLESIGLPELADIFKQEKIDMDSMLHLSSEDLKELHLVVGQRIKLLNAIDERKANLQMLKDNASTEF